MHKILYYLGFIVFIIHGMTFAQGKTWQTYTNMNEIRDLSISGQSIWCATNGGILKLDKQDYKFQQFNNIDGLSSNDVQAIETDSDGDTWIGLFSGVLHLLEEGTTYFEPIYDYERHIIYDLTAIGDSLLIGFDDGVSLYVKSAREVKESYYSLGNFEDRIGVTKIFLDGKDIWAATNSGIAKSSLEMVNLKDPSSWINYTAFDGLPSTIIRDFAKADGKIYVATESGIARLDGERWTSVNTGLATVNVYALFENQGILYAGTREGVFQLSTPSSWSIVGDNLRFAMVLEADEDGLLWVGREEASVDGLAYFNPDSSVWKTLQTPGPSSNQFVDVVIDANQTIWCASQLGGIQFYDGNSWQSVALEKDQIRTGFATAVVDPQNRKWFGSLGGGITMIDSDDQMTWYTDPYISDSAADYFIINDLKVDSQGNIWIVNRLAATRNPLAVVTPDLQWQNFSQAAYGINTNQTAVLEIDPSDRIWVGSDDKGVRVINPNGTPTITSDDQISGGLTTADGLYSNQIQALVMDLEGIMWIGTNKGLNRWYSIGGVDHVDSVYELISNDIRALEVDAQNNIWVGTSEGISMIPGNDRYDRVEYSSETSPLVSDFINSITFSGATGDIYIGTSNGLSVLGTGFTTATETNYDSLKIYPNPFRINSSNSLTIRNLAQNTTAVHIMTPNGLLVRKIPTDDPFRGGFGGHVIWSGINDKDEWVASGIYIIIAYTEDGQTSVSKVAVIRE